MKKLVILGANESVNKLILKAKKLGYETHVFAWQVGDVGEFTADYFYPISIEKKDDILDICKKINPDGIASITSDYVVETVNYIARNLNLISNSGFTDKVSRSKYHMRETFKNNDINVPDYWLIENMSDIKGMSFSYPLIVKPTDRWSSKGVSKVYNYNELSCAVEHALIQSFEKKAIIEEYIYGSEYSAECISYEGDHQILALTKKFTTGSPNYIEKGHIQPVELCGNKLKNVISEVNNALDALKISYGASHVEFKILEDDSVRIIEIGARMGGDFIGTDLVFLSTGNDYIKMVIDVSVGEKPLIFESINNKVAIVRFILNEEDIRKFKIIESKYQNYLKEHSNIENIKFGNVVDSSTRWGHYILSIDASDNRSIEDILNICDLKGDENG